MKIVPVLHIEQFEEEHSSVDFYSNALAAHLKKNETIVHRPHKHDFFLCVLFLKGRGVHEIDFSSYPIEKGSLFFLKPGQTHSWKFDSAVEGYIFFHTQSFFELNISGVKLHQFPFYYSYKNPPNLTLSPEALQDIAVRFNEINQEYHANAVYKRQKLASLINLAYIDLSRYYAAFDTTENVLSPTYLKILSELEQTVEQYYRSEKQARFYADKLHITTKHLNRVTKSTLGKTTTELINDRILLEAKRLIVHSQTSLAHVAEFLGYEDYAYFSRVFKAKTQSTPLEFKKRYQ
ncbi:MULTISPECIES: helix-turn-helix domain-containing protein [Zobellia]|uniref:helix-turn-helix domain-containing protein n=1 Tax=Zobellia TaxID=112040 RepID=UPI000B5357BD|nr:helix-turn-helix domain-containing protein [Zobellia sp. OII3]MBU3025069.1 helix-turn-helix transcriptional regulator [Zobellia galactanivorans]OWW25613.1 AraC family transcriptional regulator [Zobellia sp. OII3]